jgi:hypothetical protein
MTPRNIRVRYNAAADCFTQSRTFKTLKGAQEYAQQWVGESPKVLDDLGTATGNGGRVTCEGCQIRALFPKLQTLVEILKDDGSNL